MSVVRGAIGSRPRIGHISLFYPPLGGGAEIYLERMVQAMDHCEHCLWTMRPAGVTLSQRRDEYCTVDFSGEAPAVDYETLGPWFKEHYRELFTSILTWTEKTGCDLLIVNSPLTYFEETSLLIEEMRTRCPVGTIVHDVPGQSFAELLKAYREHEDWGESLREKRPQLIRIAQAGTKKLYGSPFCTETDFTIYNSAWVREFYDPLGERSNFLLHPLIHRTNDQPELGLGPVDLTIVNPLPMKGGALFLALANFHFREHRLRIVSGGYNTAMSKLEPFLIPVTSGFHREDISANIEVLGHVKNMSEIYANTEVLLHPTRIDSFGMVAAEALLENCLVVTTDIPGVIEGVGDAALQMPYHASPQAWADGISRMIEERGQWQSAISQRADFLQKRQAEEIALLSEFLAGIARDGGAGVRVYRPGD